MLDAYIIEEIKKKQKEEELNSQRHVLEIPSHRITYPFDDQLEKDTPSKSTVIII